MPTQSTPQIIRSALVAISPILPVYLVLGSLLGLFMNQANITSWQAWFNSLFVYAGASQFAMVDMLKSGATFPVIILLTFAVNFRHSLMVASMSPWLMNIRSPLAYFSVFFVTDESWAVSIREIRANSGNIFFFLTATLTLYFTWSSATLLGWHFGELLPQSALFNLSINFLSLVFFVAILGLLYEGHYQILPWLIAAILSVLLYHTVTQTWHILIAGIVAALIGVFTDKSSHTNDDTAQEKPNG